MSRIRTYCQSLRTDNALFNATYIVLLFTMALLPFTTWFMWPIGILLLILWAAQGDWRGKWAHFKANDGIPYGLFLLAICLIPISGLFYSVQMNYAWRTLECYLWFFIAPLVILTISRDLLTKRHIQLLLVVFSASVLAHILVLFAHGLYLFHQTGDTVYLYWLNSLGGIEFVRVVLTETDVGSYTRTEPFSFS